MVTSKGGSDVKRFFAQLPREIEQKLLKGAGRAAANVIADEARERSISPKVSAAIKVKVTASAGQVIAKVQVRGKGAYIAPWLEYGTTKHIISVSETQRAGRSIGRINRLAKENDGNHSLVIGGKFVGTEVQHPGARPNPFLRPALDAKKDAAIAAAQSFINSRVKRSGIAGSADTEGAAE